MLRLFILAILMCGFLRGQAAITASTGTLNVPNGVTFTVNNILTLAGTDLTTMTFPSTSATIARTDAANTFTGHQTIEGVTSAGATGTGNLVFATSPTLVTPALGTPASGNLVNATGYTFANLAAGTVAAAAVFPPNDLLFNNSFSAGTITANHLACFTASNTIGNCTGLPSNNTLGVFDGTGGNVAQVGVHTVALDATVSVTFGDILCASSTSAGTAHDNGSTACTNGEWIGIVQTTAASVSSATAFLRLQ